MTVLPLKEISAPAIVKYVWPYHLERAAAPPASISPLWKIASRSASVRKCVSTCLIELPTGNNLPVETFGTYRYDSTPAITRIGGTDVGDNLAPDDLAGCWFDESEFCC